MAEATKNDGMSAPGVVGLIAFAVLATFFFTAIAVEDYTEANTEKRIYKEAARNDHGKFEIDPETGEIEFKWAEVPRVVEGRYGRWVYDRE